MNIQARYLAEPSPQLPTPAVEIAFADGVTIASTDANVDATLTSVLGRSVSLWPVVPRALREGDQPQALASAFGRDTSTIAPLSGFDEVPGHYFDAFALLIMSTATLRALQALCPSSAIDVRRFRPNIVIESAEGPTEGSVGDFPEHDWVGRSLQIGDAELKVQMACPRCIMTTLPVAELAGDDNVLRTIQQHAGGNLGIYATVEKDGAIAVGDRLKVLG